MPKSCLVWSPISTTNPNRLELPLLISDGVNGPIYTHNCPDSISGKKIRDTKIVEFSDGLITDKFISKTPLGKLNLLFQYASWKPPAKYDIFITRGPKPIHTTSRIGQEHIHYFEGSYRGFFFHKDKYDQFKQQSAISQTILRPLRHYIRTAIQNSINEIDTIVVNSEWTGEVVMNMYNREPDKIIYPPTSLGSYSPSYQKSDQNDYYLYLGSIDTHHRTGEVIRAFNDTKFNLKIAGDGDDIGKLKSLSGENIEFVGFVEGKDKYNLLANAKALVNPTDHSYGRVLVESLASGTPIISIKAGFAPYLIEGGYSGLLYEEGSENLKETIRDFEREGVSAITKELVTLTEPYRKQETLNDWKKLVSDCKYKAKPVSKYS